MPLWAFVGGLLLIGTLIGLMASALVWLALARDDGSEEQRRER